ncbi:uncharacterized protein N7469_008082 [Penicillium citrinum]|uniref:Uncharacterized protein n=2 Tax=Penicillium TaxID=5073 RepID=A0A9W9NR41_PENCI|nr:uncharacterized protein N7469_008082 [Penicillium citrinum]KAJ5224579.1 hypothetical protein N7469_008082 [Penicillium citrinum]KAJ5574836.1 hypothetical protein N7450_008735 [Penicillium hetheringtonii]
MDGLVDYKTWLPVPPLAAETILRLGTASATIEFYTSQRASRNAKISLTQEFDRVIFSNIE